jgi:hypothetical protein
MTGKGIGLSGQFQAASVKWLSHEASLAPKKQIAGGRVGRIGFCGKQEFGLRGAKLCRVDAGLIASCKEKKILPVRKEIWPAMRRFVARFIELGGRDWCASTI